MVSTAPRDHALLLRPPEYHEETHGQGLMGPYRGLKSFKLLKWFVVRKAGRWAENNYLL